MLWAVLKLSKILLLTLLATLQVAQGAFSGAALCREESGDVTLEWSRNGLCEAPGFTEVTCLQAEPASSDHCDPCFDIPLPSETSFKSAVASVELLAALPTAHFEVLLADPSKAHPALASALGSPVTEHLRSVRLLI